MRDIARAKDIIRNTALLELKLVEGGPASDEAALLAAYGGKVPADMEVVHGRRRRTRGDAARVLPGAQGGGHHGRDLRTRKPTIDEYNQPAVSFTLNSEGVTKFSARDGGERRPAAGDHPRRPGAVGAA